MDYKKYLRITLLALPMLLVIAASYMANMAPIMEKLSISAIVAVLIVIAGGFIWYDHPTVKFNQLIFVSLMTGIIYIIALFAGDDKGLIMPLLVPSMMIGIILDRRMATQVHICLILAVGVTTGQAPLYFSYYLIMGIVTSGAIHMAKERNKMLWVLGGLAGFAGILYALLQYIWLQTMIITDILIIMANVALSLIIVIGSLPLWESIFKVMTPLKMLEFASNDHKLLQRLLMEAPGTYHHAQMVGNLAERGAKAIGADGLLAKTGAVFHDIGKLKEPNYFIENQNGGPNPHDEIAAEDSARIIIEHVEYGVKLANEHHLPEMITEIIRQHHGTSLVRYFYQKAQNYKDGVIYDEANFRYDGPKPQSKEAAIVMLADCVEAFVRSLSEEDRRLDKIQWIIDEIGRQKFNDGQLDDSKLSIGELKIIGNAFMQVYNGLYHDRISYPKEVEAEA